MADSLELKGVSAGYGETVVLEDIDLALAAGENVSIIGRNGVGKTTLLATVMGHTRLHKGQVLLNGRSITRLPVHARVLSGLGFVPQEREIFPSLSVRENLEIAARRGQWTQARVFEMFPNLRERLDNMGNQLSGGEQQMLSIARALLTNPSVLLMDEPTEGLAPLMVRELGRTIAQLKAAGTAILLIEQQLAFALGYADVVFIMSKGRIVHRCTPAELAADADTKARYLGV
jgi:branched-chain amino acid transport system ATP-binding protein